MATKQFVVFKLDQSEYGIDIQIIKEIIRTQEVTKMPQTEEYVEGLINYRQNAVPIINLNKKLNLNAKDEDKDTRIIIVNLHNKNVGFKVDEVLEVLKISDNNIELVSNITKNIDHRYLSGIGKQDNRFVILLNPENIVDDNACKQLA